MVPFFMLSTLQVFTHSDSGALKYPILFEILVLLSSQSPSLDLFMYRMVLCVCKLPYNGTSIFSIACSNISVIIICIIDIILIAFGASGHISLFFQTNVCMVNFKFT